MPPPAPPPPLPLLLLLVLLLGVCGGGSCPLPASVTMAGLYSLRPPSLSALLPSLQALPRPGLLSKLSPLLQQGLAPPLAFITDASTSQTGSTQD